MRKKTFVYNDITINISMRINTTSASFLQENVQENVHIFYAEVIKVFICDWNGRNIQFIRQNYLAPFSHGNEKYLLFPLKCMYYEEEKSIEET